LTYVTAFFAEGEPEVIEICFVNEGKKVEYGDLDLFYCELDSYVSLALFFQNVYFDPVFLYFFDHVKAFIVIEAVNHFFHLLVVILHSSKYLFRMSSYNFFPNILELSRYPCILLDIRL